MSASKAQQKQYAPSASVIQRFGRWRVVRSIGGYNLQYMGSNRKWANKAFRVSKDDVMVLLKDKRLY